MQLTNRLALITGGGRGIGRAIAEGLAREGADIIVVARTAAQVETVAQGIAQQFGVKTLALTCDVSASASVGAVFSSVVENFGRGVDILVNNAGIAESAPFHKTSDERWRRILSVNLDGTFYCARAALPAMLEQGWGRIINVASIAGKMGAPYIAAYNASKHGVVGLTRSLAMEVAARGVTVNAICPGYTETDMALGAIQNIVAKTGQTETEARDILNKMSPQNRMVTVEEVAALAVLLASDAGRGINGQAINVDGGSSQY
jgi:NAD(P)-dependent dehydrogenase (short-subunit alcohol dehydrogenase family)